MNRSSIEKNGLDHIHSKENILIQVRSLHEPFYVTALVLQKAKRDCSLLGLLTLCPSFARLAETVETALNQPMEPMQNYRESPTALDSTISGNQWKLLHVTGKAQPLADHLTVLLNGFSTPLMKSATWSRKRSGTPWPASTRHP